MRHHELLDEAEDARRRTAKPDPVPPRAAVLAHAGNHALVRYLQRKRVPVSGGVFYDHTYEADNEVAVGQKKTGAKMRLEFEPKADLPADRVSLVQTVKRTIKVGGQRLEQGTSGMALRGDVEKEPVIDAELMGERSGAQVVPELADSLRKLDRLAARDQALQKLIGDKLAKAKEIADNETYATGEFMVNARTALRSHLLMMRKALEGQAGTFPAALQHVEAAQAAFSKIVVKSSYLANLDPRYTEKRMKPTDPFVARPGDPNKPEHHGHSATKRDGRWQPAQLRDWPGPTADEATPVTGGMEFEVAAMTEATQDKPATFVGSVKWGFSTSPLNTARIDPAELTQKKEGDASPEFFAAAERWNKMQVPSSGGPVAPLQLPVQQKPTGPQPSSTKPATTVQKPPTTSPPTTPPKVTAEKPAPKAVTATPKLTSIRWEYLKATLPPKKAADIGFAEKHKSWQERSGEPEMLEWSAKYLDWLNGELLKDAKALDDRWHLIVTRLEDLILTPTIHGVQVDAKSRYEKWKGLYDVVKQGSWPTADMFFVEPAKFLDAIEAKWKGNPDARWSKSTLYWKVEKTKELTGTYWT